MILYYNLKAGRKDLSKKMESKNSKNLVNEIARLRLKHDGIQKSYPYHENKTLVAFLAILKEDFKIALKGILNPKVLEYKLLEKSLSLYENDKYSEENHNIFEEIGGGGSSWKDQVSLEMRNIQKNREREREIEIKDSQSEKKSFVSKVEEQDKQQNFKQNR